MPHNGTSKGRSAIFVAPPTEYTRGYAHRRYVARAAHSGGMRASTSPGLPLQYSSTYTWWKLSFCHSNTWASRVVISRPTRRAIEARQLNTIALYVNNQNAQSHVCFVPCCKSSRMHPVAAKLSPANEPAQKGQTKIAIEEIAMVMHTVCCHVNA